MTILFSNHSAKKSKSGIFYPKFMHFCFFPTFLQLNKLEAVDLKYEKIVLKFQYKNTQIRHSWSQFQAVLLFDKELEVNKFESADLKYENSFFIFLPQQQPYKAFLVKNTQIRHFWFQIYAFWVFHEILQIDKFEGVDFKYDNSFSKILEQKYPNKKAFLVKNTQLRHFWSQIQRFLFLYKILKLH